MVVIMALLAVTLARSAHEHSGEYILGIYSILGMFLES